MCMARNDAQNENHTFTLLFTDEYPRNWSTRNPRLTLLVLALHTVRMREVRA